jgi:hypothetical protein
MDNEVQTQVAVPDPSLTPSEVVADPETGDKGDKTTDKGETAELRKQVADQKKRLDELAASERYWADKAKGGADAGGDPEDPGEGADDDDGGEAPETPISPDDFLDELSKTGPAAIEKALGKRGFVRKEDVVKLATEIANNVVARERGKITSDARLVSEYPELRDEKSELFIETGKVYRELVAADPKLHKSPATLLLAAKYAKQELKLRDMRPKARDADEQPPDYRETEDDDRTNRLKGQMGTTGRGHGAPREDDDEIGPQARAVIEAMGRYGVDEKAFRAQRAKERRR